MLPCVVVLGSHVVALLVEVAGSSGNGTDGWGSGSGHHGRGSAAAYDDDDDVVAGLGGSTDYDGSLDGGGGFGRGGAAGVPFETFYH
ncbi:unnamed protein product [Sphagnum jensenii]